MLDKQAKIYYTTNRKGAVRNGQLPRTKQSIRMTAHRLGNWGGHFLLLWISLKIAHEI